MAKSSRALPGLMRLLEKAVEDHQAGRLTEAERGYNEVLALDPEHPDALHFLGVLTGMAGDHARSVALIERSLRRKPTAQAHLHLGLSQTGAGQTTEAIDSFEAAIRIEPGHAQAHHHLANALSQIGRRTEAIAAYRAAIALNPDLAEAYSNLGLISTWQEGDPAAKELLALAGRAGALPIASRIHLNYALGKYYDDIGDSDRAFACWRDGARLKRRTLRYDAAQDERAMATIGQLPAGGLGRKPGPWRTLRSAHLRPRHAPIRHLAGRADSRQPPAGPWRGRDRAPAHGAQGP